MVCTYVYVHVLLGFGGAAAGSQSGGGGSVQLASALVVVGGTTCNATAVPDLTVLGSCTYRGTGNCVVPVVVVFVCFQRSRELASFSSVCHQTQSGGSSCACQRSKPG
jgi:hypothetical protein